MPFGDSHDPASRPGPRPLVLGHRGASADAPENTLAAFGLALKQGADGVELDVWRCGTGEVVVIHDEDTRRTTGRSLSVPDSPLGALRELDAGAWKGEGHLGERIPLLAEALEMLAPAIVNVELKGRDPRLSAAVAEVLRRSGAAGRVVVSSFDLELLAAFRAAAPEVARGVLLDGGYLWRMKAFVGVRLARPAAVHPAARLVTPGRMRRWRRRGLFVNVWTVDEPAEVLRLSGLGASALITNVPGKVLALLESR